LYIVQDWGQIVPWKTNGEISGVTHCQCKMYMCFRGGEKNIKLELSIATRSSVSQTASWMPLTP
jgi:hypothetical protein